MALWRCVTCTTLYAVGLFRCPRCHGTDFHEEGSMPKITRHGGPSNQYEPKAEVVEGKATLVGGGLLAPVWEEGQPKPGDVVIEIEEEATPSPGSSSSTSPEKPQTSPETNKPARQRRARTTGNRSKKAQTGSFSARSTGGGRTEPTSETESDKRNQGDNT